MTTGQTLTRTNNNPVTRIAQPGQSGHTVLGFAASMPTSFGARYDNAIVAHTISHVERESNTVRHQNAATQVRHARPRFLL
jgi:hypothetical protein